MKDDKKEVTNPFPSVKKTAKQKRVKNSKKDTEVVVWTVR